MMRISFPYPEMRPLDIPEQNLLGIFSPSVVTVRKNEADIVEGAFSHPIGSDPLARMLKGHKRVLILVDDYTRSTPVRQILPRLLTELERGGIRSGDIRIMVALGTHRPMSEEEIVKKFGEDIHRQYSILNHHWWEPSHLVHLGETEGGTPIFVNRLAKEVDFILGLGQIVPHRVSGFSGGGNIVQPGICGEETTGKTHWLSAQFTGREILGKIENPVKDEIERVAQRAGLKWIVNAIQDGSSRLVEIVAGDFMQAYRKGAARSRQVFQSELPQEADIVIADSHPYDTDLWLATKGVYASELAVRQGGVVILVSPCPEGISPSHPEVLEMGYQTFKAVDEMVRKGAIKKLSVAAHLVHGGRVIRERAKGIMVCPGISREETEKLGFLYAREPQESLEMAFSLLSRNAKVAVLQRGGEILPVIRSSYPGAS
jgi:nickel-dependent lactate racemase